MILYLIRHGEAESDKGRSSAGRYREPGSLTDKGRDTVIKNARLIKKKGVVLDEIWHSVKLRAKQTADIIAKELDVAEVYKKNFLLPDDSIDRCLEKIDSQSSLRLAIVGHLPYLSNLAESLLSLSDKMLDFKAGGIACLSSNGPAWRIEWLVGAEVLKK